MDIKNNNLIKTIMLEGVKVVGDPKIYAKKYYDDGADEIFLNDAVASLYDRNSLLDVIKDISKEVFIPITVAGGLRNLKDVENALNSGADKVALNSILHKDSGLINEIVKNFGSNCMVIQIDAKKITDHKWEPYMDGGRERTYKDVIEWVKETIDRGAGEIFLQCVDMDGRQKGFDLKLAKKVVDSVKIPVVVSSGAGKLEDIKKLIKFAKPSGIAIASLLHYNKFSIREIKEYLKKNNIKV